MTIVSLGVCLLDSFSFTDILHFSSIFRRTISIYLFNLNCYSSYICDIFIFAYVYFITQTLLKYSIRANAFPLVYLYLIFPGGQAYYLQIVVFIILTFLLIFIHFISFLMLIKT